MNVLLAVAMIASVVAEGELGQRVEQNYRRLQTQRFSSPGLFVPYSQVETWPGDTYGRVVLGLVSDWRATGVKPRTIEGIIADTPQHLNEKGYFGPLSKGEIDEQRLSGHGWMLRGLSEYYLQSKDARVLPILRGICDNVFLPATEGFKKYPIDPAKHAAGKKMAAGQRMDVLVDGWKLSTDIGSWMIGLDGYMTATAILGDEKYKPLIENAVNRYLEIDIEKVQLQAHAALTGLRALLRFGDKYLAQVEQRWQLYLKCGMNEYYGNHNWFGRYGYWCEPCAIVDSYIIATKLWELTGKAEYLEWAEKIYWNGICRTQRRTGGFGLDNTPGKTAGTKDLCVSRPESFWGCSMRGAEGLYTVSDYSVKVWNGAICLAQPHACTAEVLLPAGKVKLQVLTDWPFRGQVRVRFIEVPNKEISVKFFAPSYAVTRSKVGSDGFVERRGVFKPGQVIDEDFTMKEYEVGPQCAADAIPGTYRKMRGPLLLGKGIGGEIYPIYHMMDAFVWEHEEAGRQILFTKEK